MPVRYVIEKTQRLVFSTGWGRVTAAEILSHRTQLTADPDFDPTFNQLADGRAVTAVDVSLANAKDIASCTVFSSTSRRAFVARELAVLSLVRLMESIAHQQKGREEVRVFLDLASALKWLGVADFPR